MIVATGIPPRTPIRCDGCGQIIAWRLRRSGAALALIAANVHDEADGTVRIQCHGCRKRVRVTVVEVAG
jgi:hypothetical protein